MTASLSFTKAAKTALSPEKQEVFISEFATLINDRINLWNASHKFSEFDKETMGGVPGNTSRDFLARKIFVYLEGKRAELKEGSFPRESFVPDLIKSSADDPEIHEAEYDLAGPDRRLTQGARLMIACSLNRIFFEECDYYKKLRTFHAYQSIGHFIYEEGRDFLLRVGNIREDSLSFKDEMTTLCKDLMGHQALTKSHAKENVDYSLKRRIEKSDERIPTPVAANDMI